MYTYRTSRALQEQRYLRHPDDGRPPRADSPSLHGALSKLSFLATLVRKGQRMAQSRRIRVATDQQLAERPS